MTAAEFWNSYAWEVQAYFDAYKVRARMQDEMMWIGGMYNLESTSIAIANAFRKKTQKALEYRKKSILTGIEESNKPLTEIELQKQRELFVARLMVMQTNFEINHPKAAG